MSIFEYPFMQRAFLVGILLALIIPCVGIVIVLKRLSMIGDALSHTSLAGVAAGLLFNINPVLGATAACVAAAFGIEAIRKKLPRYAEMSIAIILSAGVGLAGVLSGFVRSAASFNSFLFGSIVAISDGELYTVAVVSGIIVLAFLFLYKELFYLALDERAARTSGIPVGIINSVFTVLIAVTVSIAARTVGALIVSSMMVVPVACGMQLGRSYKQTVLWSIAFAEGFTVGGLFLSYYVGLKPGGTIVLLGVACLLLLLILKPLFARLGRAGRKELKGEHDD
ncbi:MAG: metal ABC transporter permease [Flavonifractor plautii]